MLFSHFPEPCPSCPHGGRPIILSHASSQGLRPNSLQEAMVYSSVYPSPLNPAKSLSVTSSASGRPCLAKSVNTRRVSDSSNKNSVPEESAIFPTVSGSSFTASYSVESAYAGVSPYMVHKTYLQGLNHSDVVHVNIKAKLACTSNRGSLDAAHACRTTYTPWAVNCSLTFVRRFGEAEPQRL